MKHEILIYNKTRKKAPERFIKTVILKTLGVLKIKQPVEMAVLVVDKKEIKRLNKSWRRKDKAPDELSFGLNSRLMAGRAKFVKVPKSVLSLGEIVLNAEKISDKFFLSKILVHSLLHLLGYTHQQMEVLENKIIKICRGKISSLV